jgi:acyl carrier protein
MTYDEALEVVSRWLGDACHVSPSAISEDHRLQEDLGLDSAQAAELLMLVEEQLQVELELRSLEEVATVGAVASKMVEVLSGVGQSG